jgi:hypothetical protein
MILPSSACPLGKNNFNTQADHVKASKSQLWTLERILREKKIAYSDHESLHRRVAQPGIGGEKSD